MAYNKETHTKESVILPTRIAKLVVHEAVKEKRSKSSQIAYIVEQYYTQRGLIDELENKESEHTRGKKIR